ncbi:hypothetical protein Pcinc_016946 [Petrolisthes cinctipes]|uniref:Uncharacterized protein n=1 Tax=Petrolisthes cinctipes TaxID=88211 RepID=A0AAE1KP68_PETCI|nr:hypothetical protein Pcinc_016946 [Petrolisthes cinctipes]
MSNIAVILKHADASGLTKDVISSLVQPAIDRDYRAAERAEKAAVKEAEAVVRQAEEKKAEREHELALVQLKTQQHNNVPFRPANEVKSRIPPFSDSDDMDSYLARFEKLAQFYGWEKKDYALHPGSLLRGKTLKLCWVAYGDF